VQALRFRFSMRSLMTVIGICAAFLALVVQAPFIAMQVGLIAMWVGPLVPSVLEVSKGGKGLIGGMIGGAITWAGIAVIALISDAWDWATHPAAPISAAEIAWALVAFALLTIAGAVAGLAEGVGFYFVRRLAALPKVIRLRAERSERANLYGSAASCHKFNTAYPGVSDDL
jgi:hypothetical protein